MPALDLDELEIMPALERVNVPSYVIDKGGVIRWLNPAAIAMVGNVRGHLFTSVVAHSELARAKDEFARNLILERANDTETTVVTADGRHARIGISSAPLHHGGHVVGVFGLVSRPPEFECPSASADPRLTPRQRQVLGLLADGVSTEQMASKLFLSTETVRNHVRGILRGLDAGSRLEAVAIARRQGLLA